VSDIDFARFPSSVLEDETSADNALRLQTYLQHMASKARHDVKVFLELVMRSEETQEPITCAPHQQVALDFIQDHKRGVLMMSRGASKSFLIATYLLWQMGRDPSYRAAIVSAKEDQAEVVLKFVREAIENNPMVQLVFPRLVRSPNQFDPWHKTQLTIARPSGTKTPTLSAYGAIGAIRGKRLKAVFCDDIVDEKNVNTEELRKQLVDWVDRAVQQTLDPHDSQMFVVGTPLHPEDIFHVAQGRGWATLKMDALGDIEVQDDRDRGNRYSDAEFWDHPLLRLSVPPKLRLTTYPDGENLFPLRWGSEIEAKKKGKVGFVEKQRRDLNPWVFQTEFMIRAQDYSTAMCRPEWLAACQKLARERGIHKMRGANSAICVPNGNLRFLGVDLAIKTGEHHDLTAFFGYEVHPSGHREILDIEYGRWDLATKIAKVREKWVACRYDLILIEDNAAQALFVEMENLVDIALPVKGATTGRNKAHPEEGLPGLFNEIHRCAWLIPSEPDGSIDRAVEAACSGAANYVPDKHTKDVMMAWWLAYQCARLWGIPIGSQVQKEGNWAADIMER
jgi:hypothetical protein